MPDELRRLRLNGRADEAQFAQNPLPVVESMAYALAELHASPPAGLGPATPRELEHALAVVDRGGDMPAPYSRISAGTIRAMLAAGAPGQRRSVRNHGAPVVARAVLTESRTRFDGDEAAGFDPAERDLAIALRSIAETFSPEATRTFIDAYETAGGELPDAATLDWYSLLAAFR